MDGFCFLRAGEDDKSRDSVIDDGRQEGCIVCGAWRAMGLAVSCAWQALHGALVVVYARWEEDRSAVRHAWPRPYSMLSSPDRLGRSTTAGDDQCRDGF